MSLTSELHDAFCKATLSEECGPEIDTLAEEVTEAIVKWITDQTFTITDMKASLELEDLKLTAPLNMMTIAPIIAPGPTGGGIVPPGPIVFQPLNLSKTGGQGGSMMATGHAYIGKNANKVPGGDTSDEFNSFTKVKLDPDKIVNK